MGSGLRGGQTGRAFGLKVGLRGQDGKVVAIEPGEQLDMVELGAGGMREWFLGLEGAPEEEAG